ncbi:hypothetical protein COCVIDRAFT_34719 [Bipolaris victoriae FI3]|uniref:Uncharacterized protein n=1 Tax=Bipolaris victoriae (strain FI3) TaxID=930091 RepID=W7EUI8_BIPV3|nr:hypothetical protein COCVIDRAFT_34719 [Bipolaris victoriae FI3]
MATNDSTPVCLDWTYLHRASNVHVAKDRGWFKTYTPFTSQIKYSLFCSPRYLPILGVGTVEVPTERLTNQFGVSDHGFLHLKKVLHVPDSICNVIGDTLDLDGHRVQIYPSEEAKGTISDSDCNNMAYFEPNAPFYSVKVRNQPGGPKLGPSVLRKNGMYMLSCYWMHSKGRKYRPGGDHLEDLQSILERTTGASSPVTDTNPPYTEFERRFLECCWDNESTFLSKHDLNIYNDEDCEKGRLILRELMREKGIYGEIANEEGSDYDYDEDEFDDPAEFTSEQLKWIQTHYISNGAFMFSHGLNLNCYF